MYKVWATYKNADMTEGKGPMVLDKIFGEERDAHEYINKQAGISGRTPLSVGKPGSWENSGMGDWKVKPLQVLAHLEDGEEYERKMARESALAKLTLAERKVLGL